MIKQRTLKNSIKASGVGLHTGKKVYMTLHPAPANSGIVFRRVDLDPVVEIPAQAMLVTDTVLSTNLTTVGGRVATVEHVMSAFAGLGVDNAVVDLTAEEVPIMDGSAAHFVFLIQSAGIEEQDQARQFVRIKRPVIVQRDDKLALFKPYDGYKLTVEIDFDHPAFKGRNMTSTLDLTDSAYIRQISRARTFGFMSDIEYLRSNNLAKGGSMENAIVVDDDKILNDGGLRYDDEFAKHKVLDAIGDLYLIGRPVIGEFQGIKTGHHMNNLLLREVLSSEDNYELITLESSPVLAQSA